MRRLPGNGSPAGGTSSARRFHADTHIHSKYSRACSKNCDLEHLAWWALRKGISVVGTGDFTHPAWAGELPEKLVPAEPGLFRLRSDLERQIRRTSPGSLTGPIRFMLSVEISTIYRRAAGGDARTRKVHHLLYAPTFAAADRIRASLGRIGNLASDGRPILGLDSRDLLEITLESDPGSYLIPAHVWTPWFAVLGSKSGFDAVPDCYADLAGHVFALETGLSSDPPMNWMCSALDSYRLVSNSDAHSPPMLGREATTFCTDLDYFAMRRALETGDGLAGTIEFFPEEGKYHLDGHRKCGIRFSPDQTLEHQGDCPECGKALTVGVLHRVAELADRPQGYRPAAAAGYRNLVQLAEILAEILGTGPKSKRVTGEAARLVAELGPELAILDEVPTGDIARAGGTLLAEAISRLRRGEVTREAGYDGEYGMIRLLKPEERTTARTHGAASGTAALFDVPAPEKEKPDWPALREPAGPERLEAPGPAPSEVPEPATSEAPGPAATDPAAPGPRGGLLGQLDPDQQKAAGTDPAEHPALLIVAGPGTGKTRTLAYRIAHLVAEQGVAASQFLAVTFTRRAAGEMRERLAGLLPGHAGELTVTTFHGLGLRILRDHHEAAGLPDRFGIADETERLAVAAELAGSESGGRTLLKAADADPAERARFREALRARGLTDFAGLTELPAELLRGDPGLAASYRRRWAHISVDEYQDIDETQYGLLRLLAAPHLTAGAASLTAIGDPDQAIYGFRGADVGFFLRFTDDFPGAATVTLTTNYRSPAGIVRSAMQAIAPATLIPGRVLRPACGDPPGNAGRGAARGTAAGQGTGSAGPVTVHEAADEQAEAAWIARTVDGLLGGVSFHSLDSGRADGHGHGRIGLADIAVLYRTSAQAGALIQALTRSGLPAQNRSHDRLAHRPGVDLLLRQLQLGGQADSVPDRLRAAARAVTALLPATSPAAVDVRAAAEVLMPLARRCGGDLERFRTEVALGAESDAADPRADAVTLLTLHAAKGLEFPVVFLAGCEDGLLPLRLPWARRGAGQGTADTAVDTAEERRLLFVGMTRARSRLFLSYARRRELQAAALSSGTGGPSPFLRAIGPELLERSRQAGGSRRRDHQLRLL
jgi:DNA helicase II / ATP-dependent DNA helicase PcrA